ncbi:MAG: FecR domain-containing protein [Gammaproteobacteria bacterium]|nr:FecR domain-containing protein [Gammaproteobacteria bacterium]
MPYGFTTAFAQEQGEIAGRVIITTGDVGAVGPDGQSRPLSRRDQVFVGDRIITAANATTQIRMVDSAIIALKESTEFAIVAFEYEEAPATDESRMELISGGFRTITGAIGEQNRDNYEVDVSQFATIGIRGTDYEVVITPVGEVVTGVYDGGTTIENNAGSLDLGVGADFDFARVEDADTPPEGLLEQPAELGVTPEPLADNSDDDDEGDDGDDGGDDGGDGTDGTDDSPGNSGNGNGGGGNNNQGQGQGNSSEEEESEEDDSEESDDNSPGNSGNGGGNGTSGNSGQANNLSALSKSVDSHNISWGAWDKPVDHNWVVVQEIEDELVRVSTSDYFADVNPTDIANMRGNHSYRTGLASSFIGGGSAGDVHTLLAGMDVNFDTGGISNGSLQVGVADQAWSVAFDGAINSGTVDLNAIGGQLIDVTGVISNQIDANLGGVFTGPGAEAFVGGFDLIDQLDQFNNVNGLFTIER